MLTENEKKEKREKELLNICVNSTNHDDLALLWQSISQERIVCVDRENFILYRFCKETLIYKLIGINEFSEIVKTELKIYLQKQVEADTKYIKMMEKDDETPEDLLVMLRKQKKKMNELITKICCITY